MGEPQTYFLETLGCPKNQVDSDKLEGRFAADGMTPVDSPDEADIVVKALVMLLEAGDTTLSASLDHVAFVLLSAVCIMEPRPLPDSTRQAAVAMVKKMPQAVQQSAFGKLNPDAQALVRPALQ